MNVVVISGNLARDPEVRYSQSQLAIAKFTVAVNRIPRKGEDAGADFLRVTAFGKQAENIERFLRKGSKVGVEGRIETGSYDNKDGQKVYTTDIIASRVEFLDSKQQGGGSGNVLDGDFGRQDFDEPFGGGQPAKTSASASAPASGSPTSPPTGFSGLEEEEDDLPF
jgi:single-strand DNA-binding protein